MLCSSLLGYRKTAHPSLPLCLSLYLQLVDSEGEKEDLHRTLAQTRKKAAKVASEMNDLKLHLETQQARNAELEKRQRK